MRRRIASGIGAVALAVALASCSAGADVTADELAPVVSRDGIAYSGSDIPEEMLTRLASNEVVVLGETHHLREHWEFVVELMGELHEHGFRQLLVERPHMNDWLIDDYVAGGELVPDWQPPPYFDRRFTALRELNESLPAAERIHVRSIDANEDHSGGAADFRTLFDLLVTRLPSVENLALSLSSEYAEISADQQHQLIEALATTIGDNRTELVEAWGTRRYLQVAEMVEAEGMSIDIREQRKDDDNGAARTREELIKQLVDRRIAESSGGTLVNIGGHHAQKAHLMGTEQEWLGDYLVHRSPATSGTVVVVGFAAATIDLEPGAGGTPFNVADSSPENEIWRLMAETWPGDNVFLPLDDALFAERRVAYNSEETIYATSLKEQFDALFQYGLAHRMPVN